jgi:Na+/melibiose symporter-like transporter
MPGQIRQPEQAMTVDHPYRWHNHITLNAYWFGVSFMWNALHPIVLPVLVLSFAPDGAKNTSYGLLTFVGLVVAALVQPISGSLSDHTRHRLGRRRPWILAGTAASLLCLGALAVANSFWIVAASYILLQCSSNVAHGPAQGLMRDAVPGGRRGPAAGAKHVFDMAAVIVAATFAGRLMDDGVQDAVTMMALIAGTLVLFTVVTSVTVREPTSAATMSPPCRASTWISIGTICGCWRRALAYCSAPTPSNPSACITFAMSCRWPAPRGPSAA